MGDVIKIKGRNESIITSGPPNKVDGWLYERYVIRRIANNHLYPYHICLELLIFIQADDSHTHCKFTSGNLHESYKDALKEYWELMMRDT